MNIQINWTHGQSTMGTAYYMQKAFTELGHVVSDGLDHELVLNIDGYPHNPRKPETPYFYWETDSFMDRPLIEQGLYDKLFIGGAPEDLKKYPDGTIFLPHAFDEELHRPIDIPKEYDLVMIGSDYPERSRLIELLKSEGFKIHVGRSDPGIAYSTELSRGRLIFNRSATNWNIPMRFFEGMAIGALVTNEHENLHPLATPYKHYIPYSSDKELIENVKKYLSDDNAREKLAIDARAHALKHHTYKHRAKEILRWLN